MIERGQVVSMGDGVVDVRMDGSEHCDSCGACTAAGLGGMLMTDVEDPLGASAGDDVEVEIPDGSRLVGALVGYGVPILVLLCGYLAGRLLGAWLGTDPDVTGAVVAVTAVVALVVLVRSYGRDLLDSARFRPRVRAIIRRCDGGPN